MTQRLWGWVFTPAGKLKQAPENALGQFSYISTIIDQATKWDHLDATWQSRIKSEAINSCDMKLLNLLRSYGADFNHAVDSDSAPLSLAVKNSAEDGNSPNSVDIVQFLLNTGIHPAQMAAALVVAVDNNDRFLVELLLEHGAIVYKRAMNLALLRNERNEILDVFIKHGNQKSSKTSGNDANAWIPDFWVMHGTALHTAITERRVDAALTLLEGFEELSRGQFLHLINFRDSEGQTPLHVAARMSDEGLFRILVDSGAVISGIDKQGRQPLHFAALSGTSNMIEDLVSMGAKRDVRDRDGHTPLFIAAANQRVTTVRTLLHLGASYEIQDHQRRTALHFVMEQAFGRVSERGYVLPTRQARLEALQVAVTLAAHGGNTDLYGKIRLEYIRGFQRWRADKSDLIAKVCCSNECVCLSVDLDIDPENFAWHIADSPENGAHFMVRSEAIMTCRNKRT